MNKSLTSYLLQIGGNLSVYRDIYALYKTVQLRRQYTVDKQLQVKKIIVWMSDDKILLSGLCDRLWGAISIFSIAKDLGIPFKICFTHPFTLSKFLVPNSYNWKIEDEVINVIPYSSPFFYPETSTPYRRSTLARKIQSKLHKTIQLHIYSNVKDRTVDFKALFEDLFKPSELLKAALDSVQMPYKRYVSVSFRFWGLLGDFKDITQWNISEEKQREYISKCIEGLRTIIDTLPADIGVFVTADSIRFLNAIKDQPKVYVLDGRVEHSGYHEDDDGSQLKTFLDLFLISRAQKAYLLWYDKMYSKSFFARTGAMIGGIPFETVQIK